MLHQRLNHKGQRESKHPKRSPIYFAHEATVSPSLPMRFTGRQECSPIVWWVTSPQHALKNDVWIVFTACCTQSVLVVDPSKNNDPAFRVEPKKQSETLSDFCPTPMPVV
jgi:hypothetical protein